MTKSRVAIFVSLCVAAMLIGMVIDYFDRSSIAHQSMQLPLGLVGASIYEYHAKTGRWPGRAEDLAETSLTLRSPYWRQMLNAGTVVVVWRDDLKPDPKTTATWFWLITPKGFSRGWGGCGFAGATCRRSM